MNADFAASARRPSLYGPTPKAVAPPDARSIYVSVVLCPWVRTASLPPSTRDQGDSSADLEYYDQSSLALPDNSTITGENGVVANLELPPLGYPAVYRLGTGASLGANKGLVIDTSPPFIVQVGWGRITRGGL